MGDLTTLEAVKDYLRIDPGDTCQDAFLSRLVSAESARFSALTNNQIHASQYTETRDGNGTRFLLPLQYPVLSVQSVSVDGNVIPPVVTLGDAGWSLVKDRIELVGYLFTSARSSIYYFAYPSLSVSAGVGNVSVVYTAGYETVPPEVDQAVVEMVALKFKARDRVGIMSSGVGGETLSYQTLTLPESIQSIVDNYTRPVI